MYHFINIKESYMLGLAKALKSLGYSIVGSGDHEEKLEDIEIYDLDPSNIKGNITVVYNSNDTDNLEYEKADFIKVRMYSYDELLNKTVKLFEPIGVSGPGKEVIVSYLMNIFKSSYIKKNDGLINKDNPNLILEMNENDDSFLNVDTNYAIISGIENYNKESGQELLDRYSDFGNNSEMVLVNGDNHYSRYLEINKSVFYYGVDDDNDIKAEDVVYYENGTSFDLFIEGNFYGHFDLPIYTKSELLNVIAVLAIGHYERMEAKTIANLIKEVCLTNHELDLELKIENSYVFNKQLEINDLKVFMKKLIQKYPNMSIKLITDNVVEFDNVIYDVSDKVVYDKDIVVVNEKETI